MKKLEKIDDINLVIKLSNKFTKEIMSNSEELLKAIKVMINTYNENQLKLNPNEEKQLIMEKHVYGCRCKTCWYEFNGEKYAENRYIKYLKIKFSECFF